MEANEPQDAPCARSWAIWAGETAYDLVLPTCFPCALALARPGMRGQGSETVVRTAVRCDRAMPNSPAGEVAYGSSEPRPEHPTHRANISLGISVSP